MTQDADLGRRRVAIEGIRPVVDGGQWPLKRTQGDVVEVEADIFGDGHDEVRAVLLYRRQGASSWSQAPLQFLNNDRWRGSFTVGQIGRYEYALRGWVDRYQTWRHDLTKRIAAHSDVSVDLLIGAELVEAAAARAKGADAERLAEFATLLRGEKTKTPATDRARLADDRALVDLMERYPDLSLATTLDPPLEVVVDRERARFSAWYELFPRSTSTTAGKHGSLADVQARLPYIAGMGFDVLYLPPIHPIGAAFRKGKNNATTAQPADVGSPWAIGAPDGGHKGVLKELGTLADFRQLVSAAGSRGIEIALDVAYQCSPDHPYVKEHPDWFRSRPDGTIQYAENPPKKYQDIYPFDFETSDWHALWEELRSVVLFWIEQGVKIFRVDNPHTKALPFWEWMIRTVKERHPEVLFLAEAFTRPKIMYRLAKMGFTQSYTYFSWRNTKQELTEYLEEIAAPAIRDFFHGNLWPNTPDILPEYLQSGQRAAFMARVLLAATLGANYGIYGPPFELCLSTSREPHSEEYLNSEKYEVISWQLDRPESLSEFIGKINRARRENRALQSDANLEFHPIDSEQLIAYSKRTSDNRNILIAIVNLDPYHTHAGTVELPLAKWGIAGDRPYEMEDLLSGKRYDWQGPRGWVDLSPHAVPGHLFRLQAR